MRLAARWSSAPHSAEKTPPFVAESHRQRPIQEKNWLRRRIKRGEPQIGDDSGECPCCHRMQKNKWHAHIDNRRCGYSRVRIAGHSFASAE